MEKEVLKVRAPLHYVISKSKGFSDFNIATWILELIHNSGTSNKFDVTMLKELNDNFDLFIKAWEAWPNVKIEEDEYRIILPTKESPLGSNISYLGKNGRIYKVNDIDSVETLTKKELESIDERYKYFTEKVT